MPDEVKIFSVKSGKVNELLLKLLPPAEKRDSRHFDSILEVSLHTNYELKHYFYGGRIALDEERGQRLQRL